MYDEKAFLEEIYKTAKDIQIEVQREPHLASIQTLLLVGKLGAWIYAYEQLLDEPIPEPVKMLDIPF